MKTLDHIAVLIPCYNEEITIEKVVSDFKEALPDAVVYVYDNNSTDKTVERARKAGAIVRHEYQQGKGNVVRRMFQDVDAECYILVDGDDTYPALEAAQMAERVLKYHADMVIGDRLNTTYFTENKRKFHNVGNRFMRLAINKLFSGNVADAMTGYRAFSYRFVKTFPGLSQNFEIETEMTIHALDKNLQIEEVAVAYRDRPKGSQSKLNTIKDGVSVIREMIQLFRLYRPGIFWRILAVIFILSGIGVLQFDTTHNKMCFLLSGIAVLGGMQSMFVSFLLENIQYKNRQDFEIELLRCSGRENSKEDE